MQSDKRNAVVRFIFQPEKLLFATFAGLIVIGAILLALPVSHNQQRVGLLDALFTATSAVCVTGLVTVDTATAWSRFGQTVIIVLVQLGGLGVMTFAAVAIELLGRRTAFAAQAALEGVFFQSSGRATISRALRNILLITAMLEIAGASLIYAGLQRSGGGGWFESVFLAISAFCNAGFSVYSDSIMSFKDAPLVVWPIALLIWCGGIGYTVLIEIAERSWRRIRRQRAGSILWSLNSRIAIGTSAWLIIIGCAALLLFGLSPERQPFLEQLEHSLFQAVSGRTAGFNTVDFSAVPLAALMVMILLMFIGGSPGSCAGGIKTTTAAAWFAQVAARLTGRSDARLLNRRIPSEIVQRAGLVIAVAVAWNAVGIFLLVVTERHLPQNITSGAPDALLIEFEDIIFEQISAFGTVGLSTGLTPHLSTPGKLWIIASMFVGRLGALTIALVVVPRPRENFKYPYERVMIG